MSFRVLCALLLFALSPLQGAQIENAQTLQPFFRALLQARQHGRSVHVLQYGDSHTGSDDWADAMRKFFQADWGDGGPGFVTAGQIHGYRRFGVNGDNSPGWIASGTLKNPGDHRNGLSGLSLSASRTGETITFTTSASDVQLVYLKQPDGGSFTVSRDGIALATASTAGPFDTGYYAVPAAPGEHSYAVTTGSDLPVRVFGWFADNQRGLTWETLGINGAQTRMIDGWERELWSEEIQARNPALLVLAYGTNESLSPLFTADSYRAELLAAIHRIRRAIPNAAILLVGPPDCDRLRKPFPHLRTVIEIQREVARETGSAFWDWARYMDESGGRAHWVRTGLSQTDNVHLTAKGYRLLGQTLARELGREYCRLTGQPH